MYLGRIEAAAGTLWEATPPPHRGWEEGVIRHTRVRRFCDAALAPALPSSLAAPSSATLVLPATQRARRTEKMRMQCTRAAAHLSSLRTRSGRRHRFAGLGPCPRENCPRFSCLLCRRPGAWQCHLPLQLGVVESCPIALVGQQDDALEARLRCRGQLELQTLLAPLGDGLTGFLRPRGHRKSKRNRFEL